MPNPKFLNSDDIKKILQTNNFLGIKDTDIENIANYDPKQKLTPQLYQSVVKLCNLGVFDLEDRIQKTMTKIYWELPRSDIDDSKLENLLKNAKDILNKVKDLPLEDLPKITGISKNDLKIFDSLNNQDKSELSNILKYNPHIDAQDVYNILNSENLEEAIKSSRKLFKSDTINLEDIKKKFDNIYNKDFSRMSEKLCNKAEDLLEYQLKLTAEKFDLTSKDLRDIAKYNNKDEQQNTQDSQGAKNEVSDKLATDYLKVKNNLNISYDNLEKKSEAQYSKLKDNGVPKDVIDGVKAIISEVKNLPLSKLRRIKRLEKEQASKALYSR